MNICVQIRLKSKSSSTVRSSKLADRWFESPEFNSAFYLLIIGSGGGCLPSLQCTHSWDALLNDILAPVLGCCSWWYFHWLINTSVTLGCPFRELVLLEEKEVYLCWTIEIIYGEWWWERVSYHLKKHNNPQNWIFA